MMERHEIEAKRQARVLERVRHAYNAQQYVLKALESLGRVAMDEWTTEARHGLLKAEICLRKHIKSMDPEQQSGPTIDVQSEPFDEFLSWKPEGLG